MPVTDRMLIGAIAANPGDYNGAGEARYCGDCDTIYYTSAKNPVPEHDRHRTVVLPALNPDGSGRMERFFQAYIKRWPQERQEQLATFAQRKGWDMAMELHHGGGALSELESAEWNRMVQGVLRQHVAEARALMHTLRPEG